MRKQILSYLTLSELSKGNVYARNNLNCSSPMDVIPNNYGKRKKLKKCKRKKQRS